MINNIKNRLVDTWQVSHGKKAVHHDIFVSSLTKSQLKKILINNVLTLISIFENDDISMIPTPSLQAKYSSRMKSKNFGL